MNTNENKKIELLRSYWYENMEPDDDFKEVSDYLQSLADRLSAKEINELEDLILDYSLNCDKDAFCAAYGIIKTIKHII